MKRQTTTTRHTAYWFEVEVEGRPGVERMWFTDPEMADIAGRALAERGYRVTTRRGPGVSATATIRETR